MRRIAVINQKGGVGKTTTVTSLGAALAAKGHRVLLVDLDPQAHLTMCLGADGLDDQLTTYEVLTEGASVESAMCEVRKNLHLVPGHIDLAAVEMELVSVVGRETILRDALSDVLPKFDFVLIDCPPSLSVLTINALAAVDEVLIPLQPHFLALQGLGKLLETVLLVRRRLNAQLRVAGIVICMYESGTRLASEVVDDLKQFVESARDQDVPWSGAMVFDSAIRRNIKLAECPSHGRTVFEYAPRSHGALDYGALADELLGDRPAEAKPDPPSTTTAISTVGDVAPPDPRDQELSHTPAADGPSTSPSEDKPVSQASPEKSAVKGSTEALAPKRSSSKSDPKRSRRKSSRKKPVPVAPGVTGGLPTSAPAPRPLPAVVVESLVPTDATRDDISLVASSDATSQREDVTDPKLNRIPRLG